jgi:hypothetical protein
MAVIGFGANIREDDLIGYGIGVAQSSNTNVVQGVFETFYRYQGPFNIQMTPNVQLIIGDGMRGDFSVVAGLRGHVEF